MIVFPVFCLKALFNRNRDKTTAFSCLKKESGLKQREERLRTSLMCRFIRLMGVALPNERDTLHA